MDFLYSLLSGLASGAILLGVSYLYLEKKLRLSDREEQDEHERQAREETVQSVLHAVLQELTSNAAQLTTALKSVPKGEIPYPLFDLTVWPVVTQVIVFASMRRETIDALVHAYNRLATSNEQNATWTRLNHGDLAILTTAIAARDLDDNERAVAAYQMFEKRRDSEGRALLRRLKDLKPWLDGAIDAVERELEIRGEVPPAQRTFIPVQPPDYVDA